MADKELTTDEDILKSIGELDDEVDDQVDDKDDDNAEDDEPSPSKGGKETQTQKVDNKTKPSGKGNDKGVPGKQGAKQTPGPQDLIVNGVVVAKGGPERRFYEQAQGFKRQAETLNRELTELRPKLKAFEDANSMGKTYNLSPQEVMTAGQLLKAYKEDAKATIKYLLTQAQASGIDMSDILTGGGVSTAAIKSMIEEMIQPFKQEREDKQQLTQIEHQAKEQYDSFIAAHPDATIHNDVIAQLLEKDVNLTPEAAYWKLQAFFNKRGLDFSKPLSFHEQAARQPQNGKGNTQRSLPSGMHIEQDDAVQDRSETISTSTSMDEIIRSSMREAGMKV